MRASYFIFLAACLAASVSAGTIDFGISNVGAGQFQYTYHINGLSLQANQTLDISFDPAVFSSLVSGQAGDSVCATPVSCTAGTNWSLQLFPVNNPPGAFGDYFATALVNNPSLAGPFTATFTLQPAAQAGSQPYQVFDTNFNVITSGFTTPLGGAVPEPATLGLSGATLLAILLFPALARLRKRHSN